MTEPTHLWLEEIDGAQALDWVRERSDEALHAVSHSILPHPRREGRTPAAADWRYRRTAAAVQNRAGNGRSPVVCSPTPGNRSRARVNGIDAVYRAVIYAVNRPGEGTAGAAAE